MTHLFLAILLVVNSFFIVGSIKDIRKTSKKSSIVLNTIEIVFGTFAIVAASIALALGG